MAASTRALPVKCTTLRRPPVKLSQSGSVDQVGLDDLDPSPGECLGRIASGVAAGETDRELARSDQRLHHAAALPPGATEYRDHLLGHGQLLALSRLPAVDAGCSGYW